MQYLTLSHDEAPKYLVVGGRSYIRKSLLTKTVKQKTPKEPAESRKQVKGYKLKIQERVTIKNHTKMQNQKLKQRIGFCQIRAKDSCKLLTNNAAEKISPNQVTQESVSA